MVCARIVSTKLAVLSSSLGSGSKRTPDQFILVGRFCFHPLVPTVNSLRSVVEAQ